MYDNITFVVIAALVVELMVSFTGADRAAMWCALLAWRLIDIERKISRRS